ncbi:MAG: hypothetical protein NC218_07475 [Acetobacter sp.]|nr:hypothetical protein [Acetobacter sp.]
MKIRLILLNNGYPFSFDGWNRYSHSRNLVNDASTTNKRNRAYGRDRLLFCGAIYMPLERIPYSGRKSFGDYEQFSSFNESDRATIDF